MTRLLSAPVALLGLVAAACLPGALAKPYPVHIEELRRNHNASDVEQRAVTCPDGRPACGWEGKLCCTGSDSCTTDANGWAICAAGSGQWQYSTKVVVDTYTSVYSSFIPAQATGTGACKDSQSPCGGVCCDSGFYCRASGQCALIAAGSSGGIFPTGPFAPSAPLRPTSSGFVVVTYTGTPTATVAFQTPIPTGATGGLTQTNGGGGLSGGAIAGIVIGVLLLLLLLLLLCLFCCARALFDTIAAIFGFGNKKRKHTHEETFIEEHHHSSGGAAAAGGGRWYGNRPSRPSRVGSEKKSGIGKGLGMAAALGGLALALGLKRKHDKKDDKSTTVSGSSYYYSDYTSSSSASSSDRHTRQTRHSSRR